VKWKTTNPQKRLCLISALILLIGFGSSLWIYLTAEEPEIVFGYEIVGGKAYLITPENSKTYDHDLELVGGKAVVRAAEFSRWFIGLWHGKSLTFTVACITICISLGFFFAARTSPSDVESDAHGENDGVDSR
jgi:hypothetical protein